MELMVSILIIAVLAAIAIPAYFTHGEKARGSKALETLNLIRSAEILYASSFAAYTNNLVLLQTYSSFVINDGDWKYSLANVSPSTFTAVATRTIPQRPDYDNHTITIDENAVVTVNGVVNGLWP